MFRIVCLVYAQADRVSFTWTDGAARFNPYHLTGPPLEKFRGYARSCRMALDQVARDHLDWVKASDTDRERTQGELRQSCHRLARAGHDLYRWLFQPEEDAGSPGCVG